MLLQVIQDLDDKKIRIYEVDIAQSHEGTKGDPLTTIALTGKYEDVEI